MALPKLLSADFNSLVNQVDWNLKSALEKHHDQLKALDRNLRQNLVISVPSLLFSIVAAFQPTIGVILPSWAVGLVGATKSKGINQWICGLRERSPIAGQKPCWDSLDGEKD